MPLVSTPGRRTPVGAALVAILALAHSLDGQAPEYAGFDGQALYAAACANCHGADGTGSDPSFLAFEEAMPDFSDCNFASREPDADWIAVAHDGGPTRGFSRMMPAFGGLLTPEQLQRVMTYIRGFCGDSAWPRGELNLPRALLTEKAYPEDEAVWELDVPVDEGYGAVNSAFVWEQRFGARTQVEVVVPFGVHQRGGDLPGSDAWVGGLGDLVVGLKHVLWHSYTAGSIVSLGAEVKLPTGKVEDGFGSGNTVTEGFVSYGQILPWSAFLQLQAVGEFPLTSDAENEAVLRGGLGRTFTTGGSWGRSWSPMVEVQAKRELEGGASWGWDLVPQLQVSLNQRQHILANVGVLLPLTDADVRRTALYVYVLWDWFDGGFFDGW